jgi:hypothetical protein
MVPPHAEDFLKVTKGSTAVLVKSLLPGSPAQLCRKIRSGDELLAVCVYEFVDVVCKVMLVSLSLVVSCACACLLANIMTRKGGEQMLTS